MAVSAGRVAEGDGGRVAAVPWTHVPEDPASTGRLTPVTVATSPSTRPLIGP